MSSTKRLSAFDLVRAFGAIGIIAFHFCCSSTGEVTVSSWAFCETQNNNRKKTVSLVLQNDAAGKHFSLTCAPTARPDVYEHFKSQKQINGTQHGYRFVFSASTLPEGTYKLLLYCKENQTAAGTILLNKQISIVAGDVSLTG